MYLLPYHWFLLATDERSVVLLIDVIYDIAEKLFMST